MPRKLMYSQKWFNINSYPSDYYELLYQYYSTMGKPLPVTYYHYDLPNSVTDTEVLDAGSYELLGELSGNLWKKIILFPVFQTEQFSWNFNANEMGMGKFDQLSSVYIPSIYEIYPRIHDFIVFDHPEKRNNPYETKNPLMEVVNLEKASTGELTFWKLSIKPARHAKGEIEHQLSGNYTFIDYEKKIYRADDALYLAKMAAKNKSLEFDNFFNKRTGLYMEKD